MAQRTFESDATRSTTAAPQNLSTALDGQTLSRICKQTPASDDDGILLHALHQAFPAIDILLARRGHAWYRLGGVVCGDGARVAHDLCEWAERSYIECGQNFQTLIAYCIEQDLIATRHKGTTLYLVASLGPHAADFMQVEIDKTQEFADRRLVDPAQPPEDLEELVDPLHPYPVEPTHPGPIRYTYRRKTDVAIFMAELAKHRSGQHPAQRFMADWDASSSQRHVFCQEWSLRLSQHRGKFGQTEMNVEVVPNRQVALPRLAEDELGRGLPLHSLLSQFDRDAGYPFAWYFHMVSRQGVAPLIAQTVHGELSGAFAYLPARDVNVLERWVEEPYFV